MSIENEKNANMNTDIYQWLTDKLQMAEGAEAAKAASANAAAGEGMESQQSPLLAKAWKQSPLTLTVIMALTVAAAEMIIDMAGPAVFNRVVGPVAGAATEAGLCILRSLREAGVREEASIVGAAAVAGGIAGTVAADILQVLSGAQSQRGSAVIGTMAGAAIIAVSGLHMQLLIDTVKGVIALVEREISTIQWGTKVRKLASLTATVIAAVLKMSQSAALAIAAGAAAASDVVAGAEASGVGAEGSTASGVVVEVTASGAAAAGTVERLVALSEINGAQQEGQSETQAPVMQSVTAASPGHYRFTWLNPTNNNQGETIFLHIFLSSSRTCAAGKVEGLVEGSGINGSQQEGQSETQTPVTIHLKTQMSV
ncbi:uncharacterized protein LOC127509345 [Ctenopharyngodon idella]|uniref:uncharacterized protein LOC127509345 n=1 Tax=Ctenopharyngodon idella TaxID=7959 RepID=UPI0022329EDF|nr:uncharacterized protein LOC127509345 [Ctenopharyngodon idella]